MDFSLTIWPTFLKFVQLSQYTIYTKLHINHACWCQLMYWLLYIDHNYVQGVVNKSVKKLNVLLRRLLLALSIAFKNRNFLLHVLKLWSNHLAKIFEWIFWDYLNDRFHKLIFKDTIDYVIESYAIKRFEEIILRQR